jgi:gluconate 2-dehydrogenase gamma chain
MNRRDSLKIIGMATLTTAFVDGCRPGEKSGTTITPDASGRQPFETGRDKRLVEEKFFDAHEMATITILVDLILPKDERSGSATDAKVPEFIEFIVKDEPVHQLPLRGGLRWLDVQCLNRFANSFRGCTPAQQTEIITAIAYPSQAKPDMQPGVAFFNKIRDLTAVGFFTSKMGIEDLGYKGNAPNQWKGVPPEILKQYGLENV